MLAYSSVSHAGFMLIAIAADNELGGEALLFYLIPYGAMPRSARSRSSPPASASSAGR